MCEIGKINVFKAMSNSEISNSRETIELVEEKVLMGKELTKAARI